MSAANAPRSLKREYAEFTTWDLLKAQRIARRIRDGERVLDVGTGNGARLHHVGLFRDVERHGVDVHIGGSPEGVHMHTYDGRTLPFPAGAFDVTMVCYVLHHLTPAHAQRLLEEIARVTRRQLIVLEDSMPSWGFCYRLRNWFHRVESDLQYQNESTAFTSPGSEAMFLTHAAWETQLRRLPGVRNVRVEPLIAISKYAHHTLFDVQFERAGPGAKRR